MRTAAVALLALMLLGRCATGAAESEEEERERRAAKPRPNRPLAVRIEARAAGGTSAAEPLRVRVDWSRNGTMTAAEMYSSGAGIWNNQRAFRMSNPEIAAVARLLRDARFANMAERYGEMEEDFLKINGKISVSVGDAGKSVIQLERGPQSDELATLAAALLARAESASRGGAVADSLADGLAKIAAGALPEEALQLTAQVRDDRGLGSGFLVHIRGGEAVARGFDVKAGYSAPRRLSLPRGDLMELAALLQALDPATLPAELFAPEYVELRVEVLGKVADRQARPYAGVTAATHGARQAQFDRVIDALRRVAVRTLAQGSPAPALE
jgi:hypothetical protein